MPKCYQLIGVPGSGKSTWVASQEWFKDCAYVSTDNYIEEYAKHVGKTYSEVFHLAMTDALTAMVNEVLMARSMNQDIIWDQTSTTVNSRVRKFNMLPDYHHIAVVFPTPTLEVLKERLANRPGKNVPWDVVQGMINSWEEPTEKEGFKEIRFAARPEGAGREDNVGINR